MSLFNVGFVIFPDLTQLDFTGPQQVLARLPQSAMHIVAKSAAPMPSDSDLSRPHAHIRELPAPGFDLHTRWHHRCCSGDGRSGDDSIRSTAVEHGEVRDLGVYRGLRSRCCWIAKGRRATTHWAFTELLPL